MTAVPALALLAFFALGVVLLILPFAPAVREWRSPTDVAPLPVSDDAMNDVYYFARELRRQVEAAPTGEATGPDAPLVMSQEHPPGQPLREDRPIFATRDVVAASGSSVTGIYAQGRLSLGGDSEVLAWGHADESLHLGPSGRALGRLTAGRILVLGAGCAFLRLHAPVVRFGSSSVAASDISCQFFPPQPGSLAELPSAQQCTPEQFFLPASCHLAPGRLYRGSLVVNGELWLDKGAVLEGNAKALQRIDMSAGSRIVGALICEGDVVIGPMASVLGPVISEGEVIVRCQARVGEPDCPTTISAEHILVEQGAVVHGSLWARQGGAVEA